MGRLAPSLAVASIVVSAGGCVAHYEDALGYRARQAVLRSDVEAFDALMEEAAVVKPRSPLLKPRRTVLTHFLDLAGDDRFFPALERWRTRGWVSDNLTCAIHRARYRHVRDSDFEDARRSAEVCMERARAAAYSGERAWEVDACLDEAPFLTETSTSHLVPYIAVAVDPSEPTRLRRALLEGLTKRYLQDVNIRAANHPRAPRVGLQAAAEAQREAAEVRLISILELLRGSVDEALLASGTSYGALEIERASLTEGTSFLWRYAHESKEPELVDLAYAWVRAAKSKEEDLRHASLGLWSRKLEPARDAYWYACVDAVRVEPVFSSASAGVTPVRALQRDDALVKAGCEERHPGARTLGPFPLKATMRGAVTSSVAGAYGVDRVRLRLAATMLVRSKTEPRP